MVSRLDQYIKWPDKNDALSVLLKPAGSRCNIDCLYCYDKRRELADGGYLSVARLEKFLKLAAGHPLNVTLHGGEPLVTPDWRLKQYADVLKTHDSKVTMSVVTNGLLLSEPRLHALMSIWEDLSFSISYDGPGELSKYRLDYKHRSTDERAKKAINLLNRNKVNFSVFSVITKSLFGHEEEYFDDLSDYSYLKLVKLLPCLDYGVKQSDSGSKFRSPATISSIKQSSAVAEWALYPSEYTQLVLNMSRIWIDRMLYEKYVLEPTASVIIASSGGDSGYTDFSWYKQPFIVVLSSSGILSTSDEFEGRNAVIGNVDDLDLSIVELIRTKPTSLWEEVGLLLQECQGCSHFEICRGGNWPDRLAYLPNENLAISYCEQRKRLIDEICKLK